MWLQNCFLLWIFRLQPRLRLVFAANDLFDLPYQYVEFYNDSPLVIEFSESFSELLALSLIKELELFGSTLRLPCVLDLQYYREHKLACSKKPDSAFF